jgi:uncharacterized protein YfaS (alpha-2-macroglobulin family)
VDIISSRPLLIRPQTPRFFVAGDQAMIGAAIHNNTQENLSVEVLLEALGVKLDGQARQKVSIEAGKQAYVMWPVMVLPEAERVDLAFSAQGGAYQDATRPTLGTLDNQGIPVYRYEAPETVGSSGEVAAEGSRSEMIRLPTAYKVSSGNLRIDLETSLAAGMTAGLKYLEHYPYECTEQTVSRFLPNILTLRALKSAGLNDAELEKNLQAQLEVGLQRLYNRQHPDGGWGWWDEDESDTLTSAYVLMALTEAQEASYKVDAKVTERGLSFLYNGAGTADLNTTWGRNRQAFILYVLSQASRPNVAEMGRLYEVRSGLHLYAQALLAQALYHVDPMDSRVGTLRSDLVGAAILSAAGAHWQEVDNDRWNWNTDVRTTAIILDTLIKIDPQNELNANVVRWLMVNRENGHWASTQETAFALKALTGWLVTSGELKANYAYGVSLNGQTIASGLVNEQNLRDTRSLQIEISKLVQGEANRLAFARTGGDGRLYYTTYLTTDLPVPEIKALDRGITVSRRYYRPENTKASITQAGQGEVFVAQLTVVVPNDLHNVLITDPLPAGLEVIDPALKTSPIAQQPEELNFSRIDTEGWGWWYFTHSELRDEKVVLSTNYLPAGTYVYTYRVRASTRGTYQVIPPTASEFYFPDVYGRGAGSLFTVQ